MPGRSATKPQSSWMSTEAWVKATLGRPPARVREVGCGDGRLARALKRRGYDVVAVDPNAPKGRIFRQSRIEDFDEARRFDVAVAGLSLHHVDSLAVVLDRISSLLRARGRIIVYEFAWDKFDRKTAEWFWMRRSALKPGIRQRLGGRTAADSLKKWRRTFDDLHRYPQLRQALDRRFATRFFAWTPYLHEFPGVDTAAHERRAIETGVIRPLRV